MHCYYFERYQSLINHISALCVDIVIIPRGKSPVNLESDDSCTRWYSLMIPVNDENLVLMVLIIHFPKLRFFLMMVLSFWLLIDIVVINDLSVIQL